MFQIFVSLTTVLTRANLHAKWVLAGKVAVAVHLSAGAFICTPEEALFVWESC